MFRTNSARLTLIASLTAATGTLHAQPIALPELPQIDLRTHTPPQVYTDQVVLSVRTTTQSQLDTLLGLVESVWSERTGVGLMDVQINRSHLPTLTKLGIGYDILINDLQAHQAQRWAQMQRLEQLDHAQPRGAGVHSDAWFSNYKQFSDIISYFNNIAAIRPDIATMSDVGDSLQSNDIYALTITGPDTAWNPRDERPVVIWNGGQHAREWVSPMTVSYIASKLVDDYGSDPRVTEILNNTRIVILPVINPDGYLYTWSNERYWRKNRRNNGGSFGVDLNRNWAYEWGGQGASTSPNDDTYRGPGPFSEPETQVLRDLALSFGDDLVAHIDYHTYSQLILWPFGYADGVQTPEPDRTFFDELTTAMSDEILDVSGVFYNPIQSVDLYPASGACTDWFYGELGAKSLTIELRPADGAGFGGFDPDPSVILPTARENYEAAKLFVERTTQPVAFDFSHAEIIEADTPTTITLSVSDVIATHIPSSVSLSTRIGASDAIKSTPMTALGDNQYSADLPAVPCGTVVHYGFLLETTDGDTIDYPSSGEFNALAQEFTISFSDDMEIDTGWVVGDSGDTASSGVWNRMNPQGTDAQPENDHTPGTGTDCWVTDGLAGTGLGDRDIDGGTTTLTSPILDAIALGDDAELVYWRWYSNNTGASPNEDTMLVQISNDIGNSWTTLEEVSENAGDWVEARFRIADFVEPTDMIKVRFIASDLGSGSIVEAGVDDLRIEAVGCSTNPADLNGDGELDFFDVSLFLNAFSNQDPTADFNGDGSYDFFDVSAFLAAFSQS
ncbi:MAG: M14 family zinc carboxypeptidase [Phycisphaerales bacterium JB047]